MTRTRSTLATTSEMDSLIEQLPKVIIVEDEAIIARDIEMQLHALGFEVSASVETATEAFEAIEKHGPDIVLMDIRLKGSMDGVEAAGVIGEKYDVPVVYLTAHTDDARLRRAEVTGPFGYLVKPFRSNGKAVLAMALYKHRSEKRLMRAFADLEEFGYAVTHDLKEPLRNISLCSEMLASHQKGTLDPESEELMSSISEGVARMNQMLSDLREYSVTGRRDVLLEQVSAADALKQALLNLRVAIAESGALTTTSALPTISFVPHRLIQVLQNLIGNAIKHHGKDRPVIHVSAVEDAREWVFSIRDNGAGFDNHYAKKIFGLFQRLEGSRRPGSGIGLTICKRIVEGAGGRIWAESELNVGSTFYFSVAK